MSDPVSISFTFHMSIMSESTLVILAMSTAVNITHRSGLSVYLCFPSLLPVCLISNLWLTHRGQHPTEPDYVLGPFPEEWHFLTIKLTGFISNSFLSSALFCYSFKRKQYIHLVVCIFILCSFTSCLHLQFIWNKYWKFVWTVHTIYQSVTAW